jgi:hypothetical protein
MDHVLELAVPALGHGWTDEFVLAQARERLQIATVCSVWNPARS